jgi:MFS family permease
MLDATGSSGRDVASFGGSLDGPAGGRRMVREVPVYQWIVLLHIVGAFMFVMSHGVAMWVVNEIPKQKDRQRIAALLDLSSTSLSGVYLGLLLLLVGGIWAGIAGDWFKYLWIWAAIVVLVVITVLMYVIATPFFGKLRAALGQRPAFGPKNAPDPVPLSDEELLALTAKTPVNLISGVGFIGLLILLWLMVVKPF